MAQLIQTRAPLRLRGRIICLVEQVYVGRRRVATAAAAVLAVSLGYHVIFGQNGLTAYEQKRQNKVMLDKELGTLQRENDLLKGHVDRLKNDPSAIEHQAREELHYARPGEVIYTLPTASTATTQGATPLATSN